MSKYLYVPIIQLEPALYLIVLLVMSQGKECEMAW